MVKTIRSVGILGTGTMARGITRLAIENGMKVFVWGRSNPSLERFALHMAEKTGVAKDNTSLVCGSELDILRSADLIVEAVVESLSVKQDIIMTLESAISADAVIATTTSSLRVEDIMKYTLSPERTLGLHFMNLAHCMPLRNARSLWAEDGC